MEPPQNNDNMFHDSIYPPQLAEHNEEQINPVISEAETNINNSNNTVPTMSTN